MHIFRPDGGGYQWLENFFEKMQKTSLQIRERVVAY